MVKAIQQTLRDSAAARWTVLVLVASMMFFAYMFVDILSPLASLLNDSLGWDQGVFGTYAAGEYLLNVFGFLIIAGIILDKMGVRFTGLLSASLMVIGAGIKYFGISWAEANTVEWLNAWWPSMPGSAKLAMFGFMIFGCGCEMAGTTVSKILAKWFKGKEMALAMGLEMAIARLGVFAAMWLAPLLSERFAVNGTHSVTAPLLFASLLLVVGLLNFFVFTIMDNKFPTFGMCSSLGNPTVAAATAAAMGVLTPMPCAPVIPAPWVPGAPTVLVCGKPLLNNSSKLMCAYGGVIQINMTPAMMVNTP